MPQATATVDDVTQELPDNLRQLAEIAKQKRMAYLDDLSKEMAKKRDDAVKARRESGIEKIWQEDREHYLGIDDANRANHPYTKSMGTEGGLVSNTTGEKPSGCTAFFNITRQFVDSAAARMGDILLPAGDWNFLIKRSPMPEIEGLKDSTQQVVANGQPVTNPDGTPYTLGQFSAQELADIDKKVDKAEQQILDWLTESRLHMEERKVIDDAAQVGTGILRGPYPKGKKSRVVKNGKLEIIQKTIPGSKHVKPENFFPAPECGDNIQNGSFCIERDFLTARQLRQLKLVDGYIPENIDKILKEGPQKRNVSKDGSPIHGNETKEDDSFEVWYIFCDMNLDDLAAFNLKDDEGKKRDAVPAVGVLVNDTLIRGMLNPLDTGEFPYDVMPWQRQNGSIWGVGVSRQGRTPQEMLNASGRALMNNAGLSGAPQIIIRQSAIVPADGSWELVGGKIWLATEEADIRSVSDAITSIIIPSVQAELSNIIQMSYKMMEDATGVTFLLQGQQGSAPDTVGGMELLHKNSSALLRRVARLFDECITEPHVTRYYDWLLINGEDDSMKGDLNIEAIGSTALVEREIQSQQAAQILTMSLNPVFEMSPKKAKDELLRAWRFEPSKFDMDEQEKQAAAQRTAPPAPAVQAAQIRAQSAEKIAQAKFMHDQQVEVARLDHEEQMDRNDTDRDTVYVQAQTERDRNQHEAQMQELQLKRELAMLEYANQQRLSLDKVKADLAKESMRLSTQKELAAAANQVELATKQHGKEPQVAKPAVEMPGRAENGKAFEQ